MAAAGGDGFGSPAAAHGPLAITTRGDTVETEGEPWGTCASPAGASGAGQQLIVGCSQPAVARRVQQACPASGVENAAAGTPVETASATVTISARARRGMLGSIIARFGTITA